MTQGNKRWMEEGREERRRNLVKSLEMIEIN